MVDPTTLTTLLTMLPLQPFHGVLYRAVTRRALVGDPPYPKVRPLYDLGAVDKGARFTPPGGMRSLYLAADPETALAEVNQVYAKLRRQHPPIMAYIPPCVVYSVNVTLDTVLDLTDPVVQANLRTNVTELCGETWREVQDSGGVPLTQQLGQAAFACGKIQALRYPSAQLPGHACLVIFTEQLATSCVVEVDDPDGYLRERLP